MTKKEIGRLKALKTRYKKLINEIQAIEKESILLLEEFGASLNFNKGDDVTVLLLEHSDVLRANDFIKVIETKENPTYEDFKDYTY